VSIVVEALRAFGSRPALIGPDTSMSGNGAVEAAEELAEGLHRRNAACVALSLDNGPTWVVVDVACRLAGIPMVPVPGFFTRGQVLHLLETAGVDTFLGAQAELPATFRALPDVLQDLPMRQRDPQPLRVLQGTARVTFTSGTTGKPKGVCLQGAALDQVAASLSSALADLPIRRHLCVLPLAVLLENVAGVHAGLLMGAEIVFAAPSGTGLTGSSSFDPRALMCTLENMRPDSLILLPQMLKALVAEVRRGGRAFHGPAFVAVGGARTAPALIREARSLGIAVYEGYGLSECASVVSLNTPGNDRPGSVGRVLPHLEARIGDDGEIEVRTGVPVCYTGERPVPDRWLSTGDLGRIDPLGYLHIHGRKREVLVTAFGRNVSPEWVESELLAKPGIHQAMVFGDGLPRLAALIVPAPGFTGEQVGQQVVQVNRDLPDYARIGGWRVVAPFVPANDQLTANGRLCREELKRCHAQLMDELEREIEWPGKGNRNDLLPATA
jgi:long-chain acyl-CoA synthetase